MRRPNRLHLLAGALAALFLLALAMLLWPERATTEAVTLLPTTPVGEGGYATPAPVAERFYVVAAQEFLSLRTRPDASADRIKKLQPGAVLRLLTQMGDFAFVEDMSTGETGYVLQSYLAEVQDLAPPEPIMARHEGRYVISAEEFLTLRLQPNTMAEALTKLPAGTEIYALSFHGNFAQVRTQEGREGYVLASYLLPWQQPVLLDAPPQHSLTGEVLRVAAQEFLSLRALPDSASERLTKLPRGAQVALLSREGDFALVQDGATGETGYVLAAYLADETTFAALPAPQAPDATRYVGALSSLALRESASLTARQRGTLQRGAKVFYHKSEGAFAYIATEDGRQSGYVLEEYLTMKRPETASGTYAITAQSHLTLRHAPAARGKAVARIAAGSHVKMLGYEGAYARVEAEGQTGYVLAGYVRPQRADAYLPSLTTIEEDKSLSPDALRRGLQGLAERYPAMTLSSIGTSSEGRSLHVARIGNPDAGRHVLVQGGIHAREHMTSKLMLAQLAYMLAFPQESYGDMTTEQLLQQVCFHIIPMVNPDGVAISQQAKETEALRAIYDADVAAGMTDLPLTEYLRRWKANANGVDLNRNFAAGWQRIASAPAPSSSHYKGEAATDQPESAALAAYCKAYDFDATISYHAYGSVIFWEYGRDAAVLDASRSLGAAVRNVTAYPLEGSSGLDAGGFKDWAMEMRSIPSLTIEIGTTDCPLPQREFASIWERNRQVLQAVGAWVLE